MAWLTKSRFLAGLQCHKRLWLEIHEPAEGVLEQKVAFINGRAVDKIVQTLSPGLVISRDRGMPAAIAKTTRAMRSGSASTLYQPAFRAGNLAAIADILRRQRAGFHLVEVKASTSVKNLHILDAAFQTLVLRAGKIPIEQVFIGHVDNAFVLESPGDYAGLVVEENVMQDVEKTLGEVAERASVFLGVMAESKVPAVPMGPQCTDPYPCPFIERCRGELGTPIKYPIELLPRATKIVEVLRHEGYRELADVPIERLTSEVHRRIQQATASGVAFFEETATADLRVLPYPLAHLDFETIGLAVPEIVGTRPYEQLPFQWSLHVEESPTRMRHAEYLAIESFGDFQALASALLDAVPDQGPIFAYNASFEREQLTRLAKRLPDLADRLRATAGRLVDLLPIARAAYYHRDMQGSWSIKAVLPTIAPGLAYRSLGAVRDGESAQLAFLELRGAEADTARRETLIQGLLEYCGRDTLGMVVLRRFLCGEPFDQLFD